MIQTVRKWICGQELPVDEVRPPFKLSMKILSQRLRRQKGFLEMLRSPAMRRAVLYLFAVRIKPKSWKRTVSMQLSTMSNGRPP